SWGWSNVDAVHKVMRSFRPDIVHLQYQTGMYGMHPATNFLPDRLAWHLPLLHILPIDLDGNFRFVTTFHDLRHPYLFPKAGPLRPWVTRHLACASNVAIGTNGTDVALLRKWRANGVLIRIGSNIPAASIRDARAIHARYGIPVAAPLLTTFGLLNQSKGIETVIDALAALRREGMDAHLLLIGAGAGMNDPTNHATEADVDRQCAAGGLTAFVHRTGPLPAAEVAAALAASDVCVLPYRDGASPRRSMMGCPPFGMARSHAVSQRPMHEQPRRPCKQFSGTISLRPVSVPARRRTRSALPGPQSPHRRSRCTIRSASWQPRPSRVPLLRQEWNADGSRRATHIGRRGIAATRARRVGTLAR
ncbi:MAG: glycosyltransferase, partial [Thermomicrobia bacterium]|nr:glycosyltransferase [Thermomicrobia bacterium]